MVFPGDQKRVVQVVGVCQQGVEVGGGGGGGAPLGGGGGGGGGGADGGGGGADGGGAALLLAGAAGPSGMSTSGTTLGKSGMLLPNTEGAMEGPRSALYARSSATPERTVYVKISHE